MQSVKTRELEYSRFRVDIVIYNTCQCNNLLMNDALVKRLLHIYLN